MVSQAPSRARGMDGTAEPDVTPSIAEQNSDNCFRILIATDNHIGYAGKDPIRGNDAINTFREILQLAKEYDVDFVLLGGDLYHDNRPDRACIHQTIALLREYTLGDKPISFELLSDPMEGSTPGYSFSFPAINYEDPNLNVAIPVFSIHGNHDDPQGTGPEGALCALDILSAAGVINYFGKVDLASDEGAADASDTGIKIKPILLRKGTTHLALYGVGNIKDNRMHFELRSNRVKMYMPEGGDVPEEDWFNMLLVHQNRVKHGPQSSVPEGMFDDSIKLILWGHEHDCRIQPEKVEGKDYYITQPGSSVATSLAPGEALPKHVGILSVQGTQFQITEIPLKTVRPFEMDEVVLTDVAADESNKIDMSDKDSIAAYLRKRVEDLIRKAKGNWAERHQDDPEPMEMMLPLIRLKVETTNAKEMTNPVRFGQDYIGRVANPRDILQYYRRKKTAEKKAKNLPDAPDAEDQDDWVDDDANGMTTSDRLAKLRMATLVKQYLQAQSLEVLVENGMEDAVMRFVEKEDRDAIKDFVAETLKSVGRDMKGQEVAEEDVEEHMLRAKEHAASQWAANHDRDQSEQPKGKKGKARAQSVDSMVDDGDSMMDVDSDASFNAGGSKGKAKAKTNGAAKKGGKKALFEDPPSEEEEEEEEEAPRPAAKSKKLTPANVRATKAAPKRGAASSSKAKSGQTQLTFAKAKSKPATFVELSDDE